MAPAHGLLSVRNDYSLIEFAELEVTMPMEDSHMSVRKFVQGFIIVMILGANAAALHAQGYRLFVMGNGSALFDKKYYNVYGAAFGSTYRLGAGFTAGGEYPLKKNLGVEGSYSYIRNNLVVTDFFNSASPSNETGYDIADQRISADVVAHSPRSLKGVRPYISAGLELDRFSPVGTAAARAQSPGFNGVPNTTLSPDNKFGYNFGAGVEIKLISMIAIRVDFRDHITGSPTFGLPQQATTVFTTYYPISGSAHHVEASAGLVFHFGK
jgi:opacity protein-like surface antigen